ncbi:hypothetical protein GCM10011584_09470 [Nocardioides phosphati]|uniref:HNH endonuclease n=1 Tax=Nocardioides phosphati TaxID=1867775 RepID=A0ABQ2N969_9ACTN|nr:hypothetical protein GCM10011584_09470 [Nocardioides phosphati]
MADYGHDHRARRAALQPNIDAGNGWCHELVCLKTSRAIDPDDEWDLAHDRRVCPGKNRHRCVDACYLGPAHAQCNRSEGGVEKHRKADTRKRWRI